MMGLCEARIDMRAGSLTGLCCAALRCTALAGSAATSGSSDRDIDDIITGVSEHTTRGTMGRASERWGQHSDNVTAQPISRGETALHCTVLHWTALCCVLLSSRLQLKATSTFTPDQIAGYFFVGFFMTLLPACQRRQQPQQPHTGAGHVWCVRLLCVHIHRLISAAVRVCAAVRAADLYHSVFDMSVSEHSPVYLAVTLAAAAMLTLAYRNVELGTHSLSQHNTAHTESTHIKGHQHTRKRGRVAGCVLTCACCFFSLSSLLRSSAWLQLARPVVMPRPRPMRRRMRSSTRCVQSEGWQ